MDPMNPSAHVPGNGWWLTRRLLPAIGASLAITLIFGLGRGFALFVPGIAGMLAGGLIGFLSGRIGRGDEPQLWPPAARGGVSLGATLLYCVGSVALVATVKAGTTSYPLDWFADVLGGHAGELFVGTSKTSLQSVGGLLDGVWWVVFVAVDALLFAFLHWIMLGVGLSADEDGDEADDEPPAAVESPPPIVTGRPPLGIIAFGSFVAVTVGLLAVLNAWPSIAVKLGAEAPVVVSIDTLQGDWVFDQQAAFLGTSDGARRFTLSHGLGEELACSSAEPALYMIVMKPRRDGSFAGRILRRGRGALPVTMQPSRDAQELLFVVHGMSSSGVAIERQIVARRAGG